MNGAELGLFDTVIDGPAAVPWRIGWGVASLGFVFSIVMEQRKTALGDETANLWAPVSRFAIAAFLLSFYSWFCQMVWQSAQIVAFAIFPETKREALGHAFGGIAKHFASISVSTGGGGLSISGAINAVKSGLVVLTALGSGMVALISHWELQHTQAAVFNVIFVFGPMLIGLSVFGFNTAAVWFSSLLEISSWSITSAVIYYGIETQLLDYLNKDPSQLGWASEDYYRAISNLTYMGSLMVLVPVVTGRLLGTNALGDLSRASVGSSMQMKIAGAMRSMATSLQSSGVKAQSADASPSASRPGDD